MTNEKKENNRPLPDVAYEDLALIVGNADKLNQICESIEHTKAFLSLKKLVSNAAKMTGLDEEKVSHIISGLLQFHRIRDDRFQIGDNIDDFMGWLEKNFVEFARDQGKEELINSWKEAESKIKEVLDESSPFGILFKATELVYSHQNLTTGIRILTDLRPVYDKEAQQILRMVITHQLVLSYNDGSSNQRIHLAVDQDDLDDLLIQCERARAKARVASKSTEICGWPTCIVGEKDD